MCQVTSLSEGEVHRRTSQQPGLEMWVGARQVRQGEGAGTGAILGDAPVAPPRLWEREAGAGSQCTPGSLLPRV